jgi:hypothetical protein
LQALPGQQSSPATPQFVGPPPPAPVTVPPAVPPAPVNPVPPRPVTPLPPVPVLDDFVLPPQLATNINTAANAGNVRDFSMGAPFAITNLPVLYHFRSTRHNESANGRM